MAYQDVLDFWFDESDSEIYGKARKEWFIKDSTFDAEIKQNFGPVLNQASVGKLDHWRDKPLSCLALVVILDQFSRNLFRRQPEAFAQDSKALEIAREAIARQFDQNLLPVQRVFFYLPFEHSEAIADQLESLRLFKTLEGDPECGSFVTYAQKHYEVIEKFGRFPHRNVILGRENTAAEEEFLKQPGSAF
ncbi:MAG: DUF924 family protein [Cyanophyceae cyanobacterium]